MPRSERKVAAIQFARHDDIAEQKVDTFVLDFLDIWCEIHNLTENCNLEDALKICQSLFPSHILPFFEKYKDEGNLQKHKGWIDSYASVYLKWGERGGFLFPLTLVIYEITYNDKGILLDLLKQLRMGINRGSKVELYEIIFPILTNFTVPLDELDLGIMKAYQTLQPLKSILFKNPENKSFAEILDVSTRTIIRRLKVLNLLQIVRPVQFIDMGKLGYESFLYVHQNPFPKEFQKNLLFSCNLTIGNFSIVQLPSSQLAAQIKLQDELDLIMAQPMVKRTTSWNLNSLASGEATWKNPPMFFFSKPETSVTTPTADVNLNLRPTFDSFRKLTRADFNLLDFIAREGGFKNLNDLSKAIKVNRMEVSNRLKEYTDENLIFKAHQFFNIGLDLSIFFFISDVEDKIPWISHLLTFPKVDVFYQKEENPHYYFGYLKLPNTWIKPFARKIDLIRNEYDVKVYYKIASAIDHFKWGISLANTYSYR